MLSNEEKLTVMRFFSDTISVCQTFLISLN